MLKVKCKDRGSSTLLVVGNVYQATRAENYDLNYVYLAELPGRGPYSLTLHFQVLDEDDGPITERKPKSKETEDESNKKALMAFFSTPSDPLNCICGCRREKCLFHR